MSYSWLEQPTRPIPRVHSLLPTLKALHPVLTVVVSATRSMEHMVLNIAVVAS